AVRKRTVVRVRPLVTRIASRRQVTYQDGAGIGTVALPELIAIGSIVGSEEESSADVDHGRRGKVIGVDRAVAARKDVLDDRRAVRRAVTLPQLATVDSVVGREEQRTGDVAE